MNFIDKLLEASQANNSLLCIGLDPDPELMPAGMSVLDFNKAIVEATSDLVCAYKPNLAFYEAMGRDGFKTLEDFSGLGRKMPLASLALVIASLSFAGVPSTGGFMAKYLVVNAVINTKFSWLAIILVLMSVLQTAYLFRLVNYMYAKKPKDDAKIKEPLKLLIPIFILVAAIILIGVYPNIALDPIEHAIQQFPLIP